MQMVTVILVDDHPTFRHGLASVLENEGGFDIRATVGTPGAALEAARREQPSLAIIDIAMPGMNGIELIKALRAEHPDLRMLALSMHEEAAFAVRAVRAGALGYVAKAAAHETLTLAISRVLSGQLYLSEDLTDRLLQRAISGSGLENCHPNFELLSAREVEILTLYGEGLGTREICERTGIGNKTVETYRTRIKKKLGLNNFSELRRFAAGWRRQRDDPA